jgi:inorganic pyrophosphatase
LTELTRIEQFRSHPWHGLSPGIDFPHTVQAYIEITPFDSVKYKIDKITGFLQVDWLQRFIEQFEHYFSTYRMIPGRPSPMVIREIYGVVHAQQVFHTAMNDCTARFRQPDRKDQ